MTEFEVYYKEDIQYTHKAFGKIVIRHAAIDKILKLCQKWEAKKGDSNLSSNDNGAVKNLYVTKNNGNIDIDLK